MAQTLQQKARQRKIIYLALIVALFTGSLMHRRLVVQRQAEDLQLRETARGEVELTSSFVRLSLTGSRGLATTILWATVIDRQTKHEWNEVELLVSSISKLQPYFITPWVFQSWNLAFNVAVECDRPHDKYYYISRGLELLAEGERRNQGTTRELARQTGKPQWPGQPEMRHYMGFYYQLKIGNSDEKNTMRSLLELSCIDPLQRNPEKFWTINEAGQQDVSREALSRFCQDYPRLARRLRERLNYDKPSQIVKFLEANRDVPTRFKKALPGQDRSELEDDRKQFPVLPPVAPRAASAATGPAWPNPREYEMSPESVDVFLVCRTWYQYAQEPLPPPTDKPGVQAEELTAEREQERLRKEEKVNFRLPKTMATPIFRSYPARAQIYVAENLAADGWFGIALEDRTGDQEPEWENSPGWVIEGWFDRNREVGVESKYRAQPAWQEAYRMMREYGSANGMDLSAAEIAKLDEQARPIRKYLRLAELQPPPPLRPEDRALYGASYDAHELILGNMRIRSLCNFDDTLGQCEGERDPQTMLARHVLHQAARFNRDDRVQALPLYEMAWPIWIDVSLRHPRFAQVSGVQDELYETLLRSMRLSQTQQRDFYRTVNVAAAQMAIAPLPFWPMPCNWNWDKFPYWDLAKPDDRPWLVDPAIKGKNALRASRAPIERVFYFDSPDGEAVRNYWAALSCAARQLGGAGAAPPVVFPNYALVGAVRTRENPLHEQRPPDGFHYLFDANTVQSVRERVGLATPRSAANMMAGGPPDGQPQALPGAIPK